MANSALRNVYATGLVITSRTADSGGITGDIDDSTIEDSFWDVTSTGIAVDPSIPEKRSGIGLTTTEKQFLTTFETAGWSVAEAGIPAPPARHDLVDLPCETPSPSHGNAPTAVVSYRATMCDPHASTARRRTTLQSPT